MVELIWLILIPFMMGGALALRPVRQYLPSPIVSAISVVTPLLLFLGFLGYVPTIQELVPVTQSFTWIPSLGISLDFYLDGLSLLFALVISGAGIAIFAYANRYFQDPNERGRFNSLLLLFMGAMLGVVVAGNIILLFIMWELTSVLSFLLIGFQGKEYKKARDGALQALVVTGVGGLALLLGAGLLAFVVGETQTSTTFAIAWQDILSSSVTDHAWYPLILILILLGAFTKSAQFPFHFWLPGGMAAPAPASAYLHSATMVKAGIYLLVRLYPTLGEHAYWQLALIGFGGMTFLWGSWLSTRQRDLKALLAYTTIAALGSLVMLVGLPDQAGFKALGVGILAHALYKAALFLSVGLIEKSTGSRQLDELSGMLRQRLTLGFVVVVSVLSMAGLPFFLGFVAKETLIAATIDELPILLVVIVSSAFLTWTGSKLLWGLLVKTYDTQIKLKALPERILVGPLGLAILSTTLGFFIEPLLKPILIPLVGKDFKLELFPGFIPEFFISLGIIATGVFLFFMRRWLDRIPNIPLSGDGIYGLFIKSLDYIGNTALKLQRGQVRFYVASILGVIAVIFIASGLLADLLEVAGQVQFTPIRSNQVADIFLLALVIIAAYATVRFQTRLAAVLSLGIVGYGVAGIFLIEHAPDVALVQFVVETLATVFIVVILRQIGQKAKQTTLVVARRVRLRDTIIAGIVGGAVFLFALFATATNTERPSIATWYLENAKPEIGVNDVVSAILTDFRGMDTLLEITVISMAALGSIALVRITYGGKFGQAVNGDRRLPLPRTTSFIELIARITLPISFIIAIVHILYGANAPGDGFTAAVISTLGIGLWYITFGYERTRQQLPWLHPVRILSGGITLGLVNAILPTFYGKGFMGVMQLENFAFANLKISTTLVFEIAIAVVVFGALNIILDAISQPLSVETTNGEAVDYQTNQQDDGQFIESEQRTTSDESSQEIVKEGEFE